jgi:hypothetical protein
VPIAGPNRALPASKRGTDDRIPIRAVRLAAVVFAPRCFVCVLIEKMAADPMVLADFGAPQSREKYDSAWFTFAPSSALFSPGALDAAILAFEETAEFVA